MADSLFESIPWFSQGWNDLRVQDVYVPADPEKEGKVAPELEDEAVVSLVVQDFNRAVQYINQQEWFAQWRDNDILYQSPIIYDPSDVTKARVSRFTVNNHTNTMSDAVKSGMFAQNPPYFLRNRGKTTEEDLKGWMALLGTLTDRMKLRYWAGLGIESQALHGTGIWKCGWSRRKRIVYKRQQLAQPEQLDMPAGVEKVHTTESDKSKVVPVVITESYPWLEQRMLGTTLFDPGWRTPNHPEYAGYVIDVDYVNWYQLADMAEEDCYTIPNLEDLKDYMYRRGRYSAPQGASVETGMSQEGSPVMHAESRNASTTADPLGQTFMVLERHDQRRVHTVLNLDGRYVVIQNREHGLNRTPHFTANWRNVGNSGYGMGIGRLVGADQRIEQGTLNHALNLLAYQMNPAILYALGSGNAPTGDRYIHAGGFLGVTPIGNDVRNALAVMEMPKTPPEAWQMIQYAKTDGQESSGSDATFMQGQLQGRGSSAARTATGAGRIAAKSDQRVQTPVENVEEGLIVPLILMLIDMTRLYMPMKEMRDLLTDKLGKEIAEKMLTGDFLDAELEAEVLAGAKLAAKAAMAQQLPYLMQIFQQPQLLEQLHERGETVDLQVILDVLFAVSEYRMEDDIIVPMTDKQREQYMQVRQLAAGANKAQIDAQGRLAVEQQRGENELQREDRRAQNQVATTLVERALEHNENGIPLARAEGLAERADDEALLRGQGPSPLAGA